MNSLNIRNTIILVTIGILAFFTSCEHSNLPNPQALKNDLSSQPELNFRDFSLEVSLEEDNKLNALIFSGTHGNTPTIKSLTNNKDDKLIFYFFAQNRQGFPIRPTIKVLSLLSSESFLSEEKKEGYIIEQTSTGKPLVRLRVEIPEKEILKTIDQNHWYIGAMLNGQINTNLAYNNEAYEINNANAILIEKKEETEEAREIPLLTPIVRLEKNMFDGNKPIPLKFKPQGIILNFKLKNTTVHKIDLLSVQVNSKDIAFSAVYSLSDKHLNSTLSQNNNTIYPLAVTGKSRDEIAIADQLKANEKEWFNYPLRAYNEPHTITLESSHNSTASAEQTYTKGQFTLWGIPTTSSKSRAELYLRIKYRVHYGNGFIDFESQPFKMTIHSKHGFAEGQSYSSTKAIDIKELFPKNINQSRWMSYLPEETQLKRLSLIGTHDSGAKEMNSIYIPFAQTQDLNIQDQLNAGVRFLDIRLKYQKEKYNLYHGDAYLYLNFENDVLDVVRDFLKENPSETIILSIKKEGGIDFKANISEFLHRYNQRYQLFHGYWDGETPLHDVRGKILLLSREGNLGIGNETRSMSDNNVTDKALIVDPLGVFWEYIYWADRYSGNTSFSDKETQIKNAIHAAMSTQYTNNLIFNFISQSYFPFWTPQRYADRYNPWVSTWIKDALLPPQRSNYPVRLGFLITDFVGKTSGRELLNLATDISLTANNPNYRSYYQREKPTYQ